MSEGALIMEEASISETPANFYQTTRTSNLQDNHLQLQRSKTGGKRKLHNKEVHNLFPFFPVAVHFLETKGRRLMADFENVLCDNW
jgi:hypothetical protein